MLSLIYNGIQYALKYAYSKTEEDIDEIISRIQSTNEEEEEDDDISAEDTLKKAGSYYKTGVITYVTTDHVLIDNCYTCENDLTYNLKVGDKVYYMLYLRNSNGKPKVKRIISVINEISWDDENQLIINNVIHTPMISRNVIAKVTKREGRFAIVEPNNIRIDLSKVEANFIPLVGDWLTLESLVQLDDNSTDLSGEILEVDRIKPLRSYEHVGVISQYNSESGVGVIDKNVIFHKNACEPGYIPYVGDKVQSYSIESDQGVYSWRSVTVIPMLELSRKSIPLSINNNLLSILSDRDNLLSNKYDIIIDDELKFNLDIQNESTLEVLVKNTGTCSRVLQGGVFMSQKTLSQISLVSPANVNTSTVINPSESVTYIFKCEAKFVGISEEVFIFKFEDFEIGRLFHITVNAKHISQKTESVAQRNYKKINSFDLDELNQTTYIPGIRPYSPPKFTALRTGVFKVPRYIWNIVLEIMKNEKSSDMECITTIEDKIACLRKSLTYETYRERFHMLLYLEEIAQVLNVQQYNMENVVLRRYGEYLSLQVPGLTESRPSLLVGDKVIVSFQWDSSEGKLKYEGYIHKVTGTDIFLKFSEKFHQEYHSENCHVTFSCSMTTIQRCHNAVNLALNRLGSDFLFPTKVSQKDPQMYFDEYETEEESTCRQVRRKHTESVSSSNSDSCNSSTSFDDANCDNTIKSPRVSVAERLFHVKPIKSSIGEARTAAQIDTCQNFQTNLTRNTDECKINNANTTISKEVDESVAQINNEQKQNIALKTRKLKWFNKKLNYYQKEAVKNILKGLARPLPYIIFGPPGTGKTVTLCETILQILTELPESRLLVATPSNSSANLIAQRLLDSNVLKPGDLVRLIARYCLDSDVIPEILLPYCATAEIDMSKNNSQFYNENGPKLNCSMSVLGRHRITVSTCGAVGILHHLSFPRDHFSHVFIDEAGQATEPEILIPLNFIHSSHGQVVLAGDPMQLGPIIMSKLAKFFGLGESFLSRLLHRFPYQRDPEGFESGYDPRLVTKLIVNYRSLPEILDLPNSMFYDSELQPHISPETSKEAELLKMLRAELPERDGLPSAIIFHGVNGQNCKDVDSPSWYNPEEATQAYIYLLKLYKYGLEPDDIGIITPYQKQVFQIRDLLTELDVKLPKISSVEGFQGQERKVIILSVVRSCQDLIDIDIKYTLGFVASPRRLNVALTRAKALLIILGNPNLLVLDPLWRTVLIHCINHDAYIGCNFVSPYITNLKSTNEISSTTEKSCDS